jgi:hypothetical protein
LKPAPDIRHVAPLLYGPTWQSALARALDVSLRNVQRWASGEREPGPRTWAKIAALLRQRNAELDAILAQLGCHKATEESFRDGR